MNNLDKLSTMIIKSRTPYMSGKNEIDYRETSRLLIAINSEINALKAENERLRTALELFSEYAEIDNEYYQIPKVKIEIAVKTLVGKDE